MGESEAEEVQDGLHCLLCDVSVSSDCSYSIYYTVMPHSGTLLANSIQNVIRKKLDQYSISSSFLCTKCFTLFEQLDYSEEKCKELKRGIIKGFSRNSKNGELDSNSVPGVACQTDTGKPLVPETFTARPKASPSVPVVEGNFKIEHVEPESSKFDESATSTEVDPINVDVDVDIADDDEDDGDEEVGVDNQNKNKKIIRDTRSLRRYVHPCTICGRLFRRPCEVKQHLLSHNGTKPYKCSRCSKRFGSKSGASIHCLKKHGVDDSESILVEPKTEVDVDENNVSKDGDDDVSESQDALDDPKDLLKPETSSSDSESDAQNEDFEWKVEIEENRDSEENNCESDMEKPLAESVVKEEPESRKRSPQLKTKQKTARKRVTKPRKSGGDGSKTKPTKPRVKKIPGEPIRLDCSICGKMWRTRSELKAHEATHSTERPFICEICGQAYKHKPALDVHVGMHQGINPFCCPYCKKSFTQKGALQRHLPIHTGDAPFQCELCGKRFVHHTSFNMHTLAHTGEKSYKCSVCGLALLSASHLKRHTRVHTGERPYQCPTCGKRFAERYNLAAHQRIHQHSASKLHSCQLCGAGFDRKPKLEDHLASCHNKITDDRSTHKILEDTRKWVGHPQQMPGEVVAIGHPQQAWHHMIFDPTKIQEANTHSTLLPPRLNMMQ